MTVRRTAGDRGSATVWVLTVAAVLALACGVGGSIGVAAWTRHRAEAAADAAALAGAARVAAGAAAACSAARTLAVRDVARLRSCTVDGSDVLVQVDVRPPRWLAWAGVASGRARAGPVGTDHEEPGRDAWTS